MKLAGLLFSAALVLATWQPADAQVTENTVEVGSNYFAPSSLSIAAGGTVRWFARDAGHAIQADDGRFRFPATGTFGAGEDAAFTFTTDAEWVRYHCPVHPEMRGAVKVGDPPPGGDEPTSEIRTVPGEYPTLDAALDGIPPGAAVELAPGVYHGSVDLAVERVRLRGTGRSPSDVVLRGDGMRAIGVRGRATGLRVENLTLSGYTVTGIDMVNADRFVIDQVGVDMAFAGEWGSYGIRVRTSRHGRIDGAVAQHAQRAAIQAEDCSPCDLVVDRSSMLRSTVGLAVRASSYLVVRSSTVEDNVTGIAVTRVGTDAPQGGVHVVDNLLRRNTAASARPPMMALDGPAPGIGIWLDGVGQVRVERNDLDGHRYGIAVTGLGGHSLGTSIVANHIAGSSAADLAWDGIGAGTCFSGNTGPAPGSPSSEPAWIEWLYTCAASAPRPGVPLPLVTAKVVLGETP